MNRLKQILVGIGVADLSSIVNENLVNQLNEIGESINADLIAEIIITQNGINCLKDKRLRRLIYHSYSQDRLIAYGFDGLDSMNFQWGDNNKTHNFLTALQIDDLFVSDKESAPEKNSTEINKPLYKYQNHVRKQIYDFLISDQKKRVMVHMPTGAGKTRTMLEAASDFMRYVSDKSFVVVWLAHSRELCDQAVNSFIDVWEKLGNSDARIIRLWEGRPLEDINPDGPTFVVASFDTAYSLTVAHDDSRFEYFSKIRMMNKLLIVDEAHQSIAPTYQSAIEFLSNHYTKIVGLSATPGRHHLNQTDDESLMLSEFYENNKINIVDDDGQHLENPIQFLTEKEILSNVEFLAIDNSDNEISLTEREKDYMSTHLDLPPSVLEKLGQDSLRTQKIISQVIHLVHERRLPTIVFAPSKDSADVMSILLKLHDVKAESITGETPKIKRRESIELFKDNKIQVLVNYGVLTTGFDAPNIEAVVIARPTTSVVLYSQMIGRGLRGKKMGGVQNCIIVNVKDNLTNMPENEQAFLFFENSWN